MNNIYLSVIIPCYNEERNIRLGALENVAHFLNKKIFPWEVLIVDDGSQDESPDLIKKFINEHSNFKLYTIKHQGKASAVVAGVENVSGEYILFTDLDQATPLNQIDVLLPWFNKGYDLIIGSRNNKRRGAPFLRREKRHRRAHAFYPGRFWRLDDDRCSGDHLRIFPRWRRQGCF